ncbi:MAG: hypothetical protein WC724_03075 [Candidatus Paceibacterota bacterium]|jgi:hypothetical protein
MLEKDFRKDKKIGILKYLYIAVLYVGGLTLLITIVIFLLLLPGLWCWFWEGLIGVPQACLSYEPQIYPFMFFAFFVFMLWGGGKLLFKIISVLFENR